MQYFIILLFFIDFVIFLTIKYLTNAEKNVAKSNIIKPAKATAPGLCAYAGEVKIKNSKTLNAMFFRKVIKLYRQVFIV